MRPTLLFKFTICYFIILLSSLLIMNTYGVRKIESLMIKNKLEALQQEASVISSGYMESYYRGTMSLINLSSQLKTIDTFADRYPQLRCKKTPFKRGISQSGFQFSCTDPRIGRRGIALCHSSGQSEL